jgi:hypothetical protein
MKTQTSTHDIVYSIQQIAIGFGISLILGCCLFLGLGITVISGETTRNTHDLEHLETTDTPTDIVLEDIFDRQINDTGITLVDWEGYMANPAIKLFVKPPANATFPRTALLTANGTRLYFDSPSEVGTTGPTKYIRFSNASDRIPVHLSIFPDHDTLDEDYELTIQFRDPWTKPISTIVNIHVIDQDKDRPAPFNITVDFSQDQTDFFNDPQRRTIVQQAAADWAYFIDDMELESVPVGEEFTWIVQPDGEWASSPMTNSIAYTGFLLYAIGIDTAESHIGIGFTSGDFQASNDLLMMRRSGGIGIETGQKHKDLDWFLTKSDDDWWQATDCGCRADALYDLYSVVSHEVGHALIFHSSHTLFGRAEKKGYLEDQAVRAYQGFYPKIDTNSHFSEGAVDRISQRGALGYEAHTKMANGRWLITKLDLLTAQAIGYKLRPTSAFIPLSIQTAGLPSGTRLKAYTATMQATGGIPVYYWTVESGTLPGGLFLDSFTGLITGIPNQTGMFDFIIRIRDYDSTNPGVVMPLSIIITD